MLPSPPTAKSSNSLRVISFDELLPPESFDLIREVVRGTLNAPLLIALAIIKLWAVLVKDSFSFLLLGRMTSKPPVPPVSGWHVLKAMSYAI